MTVSFLLVAFALGALAFAWAFLAFLHGLYSHIVAGVDLVRATFWWLRWPWIYGKAVVRSWK